MAIDRLTTGNLEGNLAAFLLACRVDGLSDLLPENWPNLRG